MKETTAASRTEGIPHGESALWPVTEEDRVSLHTWRRVALLGLQLLALLALLLSVLGPLVDHHYAQQNPYHSHAYFGAAALDHDHAPLTLPHEHNAGHGALFELHGAFSLPATADWAPQGAQATVMLLMALPLTLSALTAGPFERLAPQVLLPSDELFLPLPEKPPR